MGCDVGEVRGGHKIEGRIRGRERGGEREVGREGEREGEKEGGRVTVREGGERRRVE